MSKRKFSLSEDEELIDNVRLYKILYDHQDEARSVNSVIKRASCWEEVADAMKTGRSVDECKRRWRDLRDSYFRNVRKIQRSTGTTAGSRWPLFKRMSFLSKENQESGSIYSVVTSHQDYESEAPSFCEVFINDDVTKISSTDPGPHSLSKPKLKVINKRKARLVTPQETANKRTAPLETEQEIVNKRMTLQEKNLTQKEEDEIDLFMRSMALKMKNLPSHVVHQAQIDIINVLANHSETTSVSYNNDHDYSNLVEQDH
ncbi:hypothetical protein LSTR_LSTR004759 [Laodelphax striatellus]|uniref:MADF domain-containing protein n=1 Tax=Laodelphax striatellus TaxID=195883 RepID=A0A482XJH1_LAOST|nr:hypothetical protein LSTR_LSTR004759 [Laodelphax striatellus]